MFVVHACACHAFNATQVLGFHCAVLAPTAAAIQNLKCYRDILAMSHRTAQAALDDMQPAAQASYAAEVEETSLPLAPEENNGEAGGASPLGSEAGGAGDTGEAGGASPESIAARARNGGDERGLLAASYKAIDKKT